MTVDLSAIDVRFEYFDSWNWTLFYKSEEVEGGTARTLWGAKRKARRHLRRYLKRKRDPKPSSITMDGRTLLDTVGPWTGA